MAPRVFVSSRFQEFDVLRRELRHALVALDLEVVALDDGRAATVPAVDRSLNEVANADACVVLIGCSYADDEDDFEDDALSTTHREFREAVAQRIPIHVYCTSLREQMTQRSLGFLAEVEQQVVVGRITGDPEHDALKIAGTLAAELEAVGDELTHPLRLADRVDRELRFLRMTDAHGSLVPVVATGPVAEAVAEHRLLALSVLRQGNAQEAIRQIRKGFERFRGDWSTGYLLARLAEPANTKADLRVARDAATDALAAASSIQLSPIATVPGESDDTVISRRMAATLLLLARVHRKLDEIEEAVATAERAVALEETSIDALFEAIRATSMQEGRGRMARHLERLVDIHPDAVERIMRELGRSARAEATKIVLGRLASFGDERLQGVVAQASTFPEALAAVRSVAAAERAELAHAYRMAMGPDWAENGWTCGASWLALTSALIPSREKLASLISPVTPEALAAVDEYERVLVAAPVHSIASPRHLRLDAVLLRGAGGPAAVTAALDAALEHIATVRDDADRRRVEAEAKIAAATPPREDGGHGSTGTATNHRLNAGIWGAAALLSGLFAWSKLAACGSASGFGAQASNLFSFVVAATVAIVTGVLALSSLRKQRETERMTKRDAALKELGDATALLESLDSATTNLQALALKDHETASAVELLTSIAERNGLPRWNSLVAQLWRRQLEFERRFANRPNIWFADYTPLGRASDGGLIRLKPSYLEPMEGGAGSYVRCNQNGRVYRVGGFSAGARPGEDPSFLAILRPGPDEKDVISGDLGEAAVDGATYRFVDVVASWSEAPMD